MIHGLTETWRVWEPFIKPLSAHYQLIIPDIRGHGETNNPADVLSPRMVATDLLELLDALQIEELRVVGYSFGAHTALRMAASQPSRIISMITIAGAHRLIGSSESVHQSMVDTDIELEWYLDIARAWHPDGEEQLQRVWRQGIAGALEADFQMTDEEIQSISAKTLIIQGDRDDFFPISVPLSLDENISNTELWIIPNTYHTAMFYQNYGLSEADSGGNREAAEIFPDVVISFFSDESE